jgi:Tfp pilus assembly protein PilF
MSTGLAFLKSAAPPGVLGLVLAALPAVTRGRPLVVLSGLLLAVLTALTGGGPDVLGYLLPLCPVIILIASEGASLLPFKRPVAASVFLAGSILLVFPAGPPLDRSRDESAEAYQRAMAAQLDGRGLFTDSSTDLFLMLHHAYMHGTEPRVIYTPYLGHEWYRRTLDPRIANLLPAEPDPPYPLIVRAARAAGVQPVFTFSDLPAGARGVLVPDGWVMRGGAYDPGSDSSAVVQWPEALAGVGQGGRHRALRAAQGGQLLAAQAYDARAASRLAGALKTDPTNRAAWHSLAALYARMNRCEHLVTSAAAFLRCAPWSAADAEALARSMDALHSPCPAATSLAERLAAAHPRRMPLAAHAARRALADGAPRAALRILAPFDQSGSAELLNLQGVALTLMRDYEHAAGSLRRAYALSDRANRAPIGANLALCLRQLGRQAEADSVVASLRPEPAAGEP